MKTVVIISHGMRTANIYAEQILALFDGSVRVELYALEENLPRNISADVVLISTHAIYTLIESRLRDCRHVIIADITLRKSAINRLLSIPEGTKAMLVNTTMEMAIETINMIHNSGINHIELLPVYPGIEVTPPLTMAITPGEKALVPPRVTNIVDLHDRVLSMRTIANLAAKLNLTSMLQSDCAKAYFSSLAQGDLGIEQLLDQVHEQERKLDLVMQVFDGGIITLTGSGTVSFVNASAEHLLGKKSLSAIGQQVETLLPELSELKITQLSEPIRDQVVTVRDQLMDVSIYPLTGSSAAGEYILMIKTLKDVELNQYKVRRQLISKGHVAKHDFTDLRTQNPKMQQLKDTVGRMARSSSSIVIYGQSGTGKELFAQSIHNASSRKDYPFIAINCASIPESLLESELFGYSEGAFTGAKKGGKAGYFELAHKGTLFLDEIGEMDLALQARILRVLQEKEVIRVGGDNVISIDVRIISASNKRLLDLVRQNKFREDLYYRLNVLSVEIPPLRERREDIALLIEDFRSRMGAEFTLSEDAVEYLTIYPWHGNVRELGNFVERLSYLGKEIITLEDAKSQLDSRPEEAEEPKEDPLLEHFLIQERPRLEGHASILSLLYYNKQAGVKQGRQGISRSLEAKGISIGEQEVRMYLKTLQSYGLVRIHTGRSGTELTVLGQRANDKLRDLLQSL